MQRKNHNKIQYIGIILICTGCFIYSFSIFKNYKIKKIETEKIDEFYAPKNQINRLNPQTLTDNKTYFDEYIAVLSIPKIHLQKGLYPIGHPYNHINYNIMILNTSDMPDVEHGNLILAAHSGIGTMAYFNHIQNLDLKDSVFVDYQGIRYHYQVSNMYEVEKTGYVKINRNLDRTTLTLITCKLGSNDQIVVIAELLDQIVY